KLLSFYKQNESVPESMLCKICYINKVAIAFLPCKHTIACFECALKLDTCGICRTPFYAMKADIYEDPEEKKNYQLLSSPSQSSNDDSSQKLLCKLCGKKERNISFLPCFHIYGCSNCANFFSNCPVCRVHIEFAMQVYL
ncbi:Zinc finger, RING-type, partial [Cinara cedri]